MFNLQDNANSSPRRMPLDFTSAAYKLGQVIGIASSAISVYRIESLGRSLDGKETVIITVDIEPMIIPVEPVDTANA